MQLAQPVTFACRAPTLSEVLKDSKEIAGSGRRHGTQPPPCVCSEGHPLDRSQTISLHFAEAPGISFQKTIVPTAVASTIWLRDILQAWQGDAASWYPVKSLFRGLWAISHRIRGGVHPCHSLPSCSRPPAQGTSERNSLWSNSSVFKESSLGWLPRYKGKTTSSHALSTWWCNIQGPAMHQNANPETKDRAEATRLPYWVARLFMKSTGDSIMARHECQNHWLHPEMRRLYVTSEKPDQGTTYLSWAHIKALGESCHWHIHTRWQELSLHSNYYSGYFEVDQLHDKTGTVIIKKLKKHFVIHGTPNELLSGNEPPFNSAEFENFLRSSGTAHVTSSPGNPQSNGWVENAVKPAKSLIKKVKATGADYFLLLLSCRNTPTEGLSTSPARHNYVWATYANPPSRSSRQSE